MAGTFLQRDGDVQIGSDASSALLRYGTAHHALAFNPFTPPEYHTSDTGRSERHGTSSAADVMRTRRIDFGIYFRTTSNASFHSAASFLFDVMQPLAFGEQELAFQWLGNKYVLYGRYREVGWANADFGPRKQAIMKVRFDATDPFIYSVAETSWAIPVSTVQGSRPLVWPFNFSAFTGGSLFAMVGNVLSPRWRFRLTIAAGGNARNPSIYNTTDNTVLGVGNFNGSPFILAASTYLEFNNRTKQIEQNAVGAYVLNQITTGSSWGVITRTPRLIVGVRNDATNTGTTSGHTATVFYQPAWITVGP